MLLYQDYTDHELLSLLKEDDYLAYTEIYNRYSGLLYVHAYKRLGDREEARDIVQELFTVLWMKRANFELRTHLSGYLYTAVRNRALRVISHKQIESTYFESLQQSILEGNAVTDHLVREKELATLIEREIDALPVKMRHVFKLSRTLHLSHREIAERLDLSEATVKKHVNNALKVLRIKFSHFLSLLVFLFV